MVASQPSEPQVHDVEGLSTEALRGGPLVVTGLAEDGQFSVLWFENELFLRRDLKGEHQAFSLVRAIQTARQTAHSVSASAPALAIK
jgi:hypothetical protein